MRYRIGDSIETFGPPVAVLDDQAKEAIALCWHREKAETIVGALNEGTPANAREIAEAMQSFLRSNVAMLLFSKLTLYRATGENPELKVTYAGTRFRVSLVRGNGEVEHFNRDGKE